MIVVVGARCPRRMLDLTAVIVVVKACKVNLGLSCGLMIGG